MWFYEFSGFILLLHKGFQGDNWKYALGIQFSSPIIV